MYDDYTYDDICFTCNYCEETQGNKDNIREFLQSIMNQLYSSEPLNVARLEDDFDNLCHQLDIKIMPGEMQIQRLEKPKFLNNWIKFNCEHLEQIAMGA